jgi:hypothetical protein
VLGPFRLLGRRRPGRSAIRRLPSRTGHLAPTGTFIVSSGSRPEGLGRGSSARGGNSYPSTNGNLDLVSNRTFHGHEHGIGSTLVAQGAF